jgi:hypothetical protein
MHNVREKVEKTASNPKDILPESILELCKDSEFWRNIDMVDTAIEKETFVQEDKDETKPNEEKFIGA